MTLDPQTKAFLEQAAEAGGPALYELPVPDARAMLKEMTATMDAPRQEVRKFEQRAIPGTDGNIPVRLYWPDTAPNETDLLPVLVLIHGGGFALADLDTHENMARFYCHNARVIVMSVDYRLAPEHKFPAGLEDCYDALCWVHENAASLGADPKNIAVTGDSAGGCLSAAICQLARDRGGPPVAFQALVYPVLTLELDTNYPSRASMGTGEYFLGQKDMDWFNSLYLNSPDEVNDTRVSPALMDDLTGLPPAFVLTAGYDPLRDEGAEYAKRLNAAGVEAEYYCFEGAIHGFLSFSGALDIGADGLQMVANRVREALRG
ncbi:MAG: alpha/beta hydrolase [Gammaproteobacteria bacterium]|nr:alpha/beta hydrolase [Gammaproteobacteria bacterium]